MSTPLRVGIVADLLEERWPSMDLAAEILMRHLGGDASADIQAVLLRPSLVPRLARVRGLRDRAKSAIADRVLNRFWDYPRWLRRLRDDFDVFHVVDHSYAHLVHVLPADRTVLTCHDTDAFLPLVDPERTSSELPKMFTRRICTGMQKAARVACVSAVTRAELRHYGLLPTERTVLVPPGVDPTYSLLPNEAADRSIDRLVGAAPDGFVDLVHVGSTIPRKRIDLLLRIVAAVKARRPRVRLLKAGGTFTNEQLTLLRSLGVEADVITLPFLDTAQMAALYRRVAVVLVTSEREGFGLPVIEALACGTPVVATDLPVLREVGGSAVIYRPLDDIDAWQAAVIEILQEPPGSIAVDTRRLAGVAQAEKFSWRRHTGAMAAIYRSVSTGANARAAVTHVRPVAGTTDRYVRS